MNGMNGLQVCKVCFGGDIGTRPAVILSKKNKRLEVLKITTKAKASDINKVRLSGFSSVSGYVVVSNIYNISIDKVKRYRGNLFDFETKNVFNQLHKLSRQNKVAYITIG